MIKKQIGNATLYCGDSNEVLKDIQNVDAVVTDPPYGLSFMGKQWDYDVPTQELWEKVYQSIKQGGHLVSFFGSRTYHRGVIPIEDAGFEIRDQLMWIYGSGFPKSHNIGKAVDKLQGNEREVVGKKKGTYADIRRDKETGQDGLHGGIATDRDRVEIMETKGTSEYEGWGTALKPAHEPIVMARKPFKGTVAKNVLEHGTGGINIDGCRVETNEEITNHSRGKESAISKGKYGDSKAQETHQTEGQTLGRFPANVMHDGSEEVLEIFPETGKSSGGRSYQNTNKMYEGGWDGGEGNKTDPGFGDEGTASRYFYCAKASKKDRDEGLDMVAEKPIAWGNQAKAELKRGNIDFKADGDSTKHNQVQMRKNTHPTVKPTELMKYLCRLVTPQGGVVLDPFMGSGSTGKGALLEGFKFVGIEMEREYFDIACARLEAVQNNIQQELFT